MRQVRIISKVLFVLVRGFAILCLIILLYASVVLIFHSISPSSSWPVEVSGENEFVIFYPFTKTPFLLGDHSSEYLTTTFLTLAFYTLFVWLLSSVFHAFKQERLFTRKGVKQLSKFYLVNFVGPVIILLLLVMFRQETADIIRIICLHLIIGVFAFFMAAIFKQGVILQEEQDLIF